jgi:hypothetical protein
LYWSSPGATPAGGCEVKYRRSGDAAWKQGLTMWFDRATASAAEASSISADTSYEVELNLPGSAPARALTFRTWPNQRPVALTIPVSSGITHAQRHPGRHSTGYVVYQGVAGATLDAQNRCPTTSRSTLRT